MFGYVIPCKMELKVKDYEKFKAYYCGLCVSIKKNFGNIPRLTLNYDMTFLAILIDSLSDNRSKFIKSTCIAHAVKKRVIIIDNEALDYAAFCNILLSYYKLLDDKNDDKNFKSILFSKVISIFTKKIPKDLEEIKQLIESKLKDLSLLEASKNTVSIDEYAHPFAELTGIIMSHYPKTMQYKNQLYWLGYNLGKWIYIIDAWDDLEKDMKENKFNPINKFYNTSNKNYLDFKLEIEDRIDFILTTCAEQCFTSLNKLQIKKNDELLYNILQFGLMEKMDIVFKRSELDYDKPL